VPVINGPSYAKGIPSGQTRTSGGAFRHLFYTDAINRVRTVDGNYEKLFFIWPAGSCPGGAAHIRWAVFCRDAINRVRTGL